MTIEQMVTATIRDTGEAEITGQEGQRGVLFFDEGEFIPFADLGYNSRLGFYRLSQFPDVENEAEQ